MGASARREAKHCHMRGRQRQQRTNVSKAVWLQHMYVLYTILNTDKNKVISSFALLFFYLIVVLPPSPLPQSCSCSSIVCCCR